MKRYVEIKGVHIGVLPQLAPLRRMSCCHYSIWWQFGPFELAVERRR